MDNGDESPLSDANKHDAVCAAVTAKLVACRRRAFDALRTGFEEVVRAAGADAALSLLDEWELGTVLSGGAQFLDADAMRSRVVWDDTWRSNEPQKAWLDATLQRLSEPALRLLLVRAAGRLRLPDTGPSLLLVRTEGGPESDLPRYHGAGIVSLPPTCPSEEAFAARLLRSLGLSEHAIDAPHSVGDKAQLYREARAAFRALNVAGQMRKRAVHECERAPVRGGRLRRGHGGCVLPRVRRGHRRAAAPAGAWKQRPAGRGRGTGASLAASAVKDRGTDAHICILNETWFLRRREQPWGHPAPRIGAGLWNHIMLHLSRPL